MHKPHNQELTLDSTYFVAFEMTHAALKQGLKNASSLSVTQYRMLVKLLGAAPNVLRQSNLGSLLNLKANVVTQAIHTLASHGFAERSTDKHDARVRLIRITDEGIHHVGCVNESIVEQLYTLFPTEDATYRRILEASISAGAAIDPPLSPAVSKHYSASRTLVSFELIRQVTEQSLRRACGASYNECRILQRLGETGAPLRIIDLSDQLQLSAVNVARATDRLVQRGWTSRLSSPNDHKAVFVGATHEGIHQQDIIGQAIDSMAQEYLWSKLGPEHRQAIMQAGHTVIADLQRKKEAEHRAALGLLEPMN